MAERQESEKVELVLGTNNFDQPAESSGASAWGKLITNLMFMTPGTMPTDPGMGCNIQKYEFMFLDDVKDEIRQTILDQVRTYYPDMPLDDVAVSKQTTPQGKPIMIVQLTFTYTDGQNIAVVAAEKSNNIINFEVAV